MPGPQWIDGNKRPRGLVEEIVLVLGSYEFTKEKLVHRFLDDYTFRMEGVSLVTASFTIPKGVPQFAERWAEIEWWPRSLCLSRWWGPGARGIKERDEHLVKHFLSDTYGHSHGIVFIGEDGIPPDLINLVEVSREYIGHRRFNIIEV